MKAPRMRAMPPREVVTRADSAHKFHEVAELLEHEDDGGYVRVSAALLALAGIAASDAICGHRLGERPRGQDHQQAVGVLRTIDAKAAACLLELLSLKDSAHYGTNAITPAKVKAALRRSAQLLEIMDRILRT